MASKQLHTLIQHLRRSVCPRGEDTLSDAQLLERWNLRHEAAFEVLLWRHGPMVLSVCRRLLRDSHDIEDAFQAAFLTLVRKGKAIRHPQALAAWLYRVAYRIALRLRREADERARREQSGIETLISAEADELSQRDLRAMLDEEIDALPECYRQVLVLCCLEGKTHEEAARLLGRPAGTISCWVKRGREQLCGRLVRRGFAPAATIAALGECEANAALHAALVQSTGRAAAVLMAGKEGAAGVISARVAALVDTAVRGMNTAKLHWTLVLGLTLSMAAAGAGMWAYQTPAKPQEKAQESMQPQKQETRQARTDRYGDPLPEGAIARLGTVRLRQERGSLSDPAFSPDGKRLASQGNTGLRMWSLSDGKLLWSAREMNLGMAFSPDGKLLAATDVQSICFLDSTTGRLIRRLPKKDYFLAFSPDSKLAVTCDDKTIRVWEIETGRRVVELEGHKATCAAFTADGRTLITSNHDKTICHWDLAEGKLRKFLETNAPQQSRTFCLSPDGRTLAVVPYSREAVRLYDTNTGKLRCPLQGAPAASLYGLSFSADSRILATNWHESFTEDVTISLWDAGTGKPLRRFRVPIGEGNSLTLAPDGRTLATAGGGPTYYVWDSVTGKPLLNWPAHTESINALQFTPDGRQLVSADHTTLRLWDIASSRHVRKLSQEAWGTYGLDLAITPDGRGVFTGGYMAATLRELATGKERQRFQLDEHPEKLPKPVSMLPGHSVMRLGLSADGSMAACISFMPRENRPRNGGSGYEVHIWDLASGRLLGHRELGALIHLLGITPGATALIEQRDTLRASSGGGMPIRNKANSNQIVSNQIVLSDLRTGRHIVTLNLPDWFRCHACAMSPDGRTLVTATLTATQDGAEIKWGASTIRFWELASGKERQTIAPPETGWPFSFRLFAFTPNGRTLATVRDDYTLQLWDAVRGKELLRRKGYDSFASALAFAPDGRSLAIGYTDSTILIWDTVTPQKTVERSSHEPDAKELEQWWSALAGDDAHAAWTAIWKMAAAPRQVLPLLGQRQKPAEAFPADETNRLIDDLDSSDFGKRESASKRLADLGERVVPALERALKSTPSPEKRRRIESLLPTSEIVRSRDAQQAVRAIEVLEHIGTAEAQQILKTLAQGIPEARSTREAKASLERLSAASRAEKR